MVGVQTDKWTSICICSIAIVVRGEDHVFTRPRRFGKSLNISMLCYYFDVLHKKEASIFDVLQIMEAGEAYTQHQNAYPLIQMTLKGAEGLNFESAFKARKNV